MTKKECTALNIKLLFAENRVHNINELAKRAINELHCAIIEYNTILDEFVATKTLSQIQDYYRTLGV